MKDIKKLEKDDFIKYLDELNKEELKELILSNYWKLSEFRKFFNFTHINIKSGKKLKAIEGVNCLDCFAEMKNDYRSRKDTRYCRDCLH